MCSGYRVTGVRNHTSDKSLAVYGKRELLFWKTSVLTSFEAAEELVEDLKKYCRYEWWSWAIEWIPASRIDPHSGTVKPIKNV